MIDMLASVFGEALAYVLILAAMIVLGALGSIWEWISIKLSSSTRSNTSTRKK